MNKFKKFLKNNINTILFVFALFVSMVNIGVICSSVLLYVESEIEIENFILTIDFNICSFIGCICLICLSMLMSFKDDLIKDIKKLSE